MTLVIEAKNYTFSKIEAFTDIIFLVRNMSSSYAMYKGSKKHEYEDNYQFKYSCGDADAEFVIDSFFSGPFNYLALN